MSTAAKMYKMNTKFLSDYHKEITQKLMETLNLNDDDVEKVKNIFKDEEESMNTKKVKKMLPRKSREPTEYNLFCKTEMKKIKENDPSIHHNEMMKVAAAKWQEHKEQKKTESKNKK